MKKSFAVLLVLVMIFSLAACGEKPAGASTNEGTGSVTSGTGEGSDNLTSSTASNDAESSSQAESSSDAQTSDSTTSSNNSSSTGGNQGGNTTPSGNGGNNSSTVSSKPSSATNNYKAPYKNMPESIRGQTVRFAAWPDLYNSEGVFARSKLEADTGLKATLVSVPQISYISKIKLMILSGDAPDVFIANEDYAFPTTLEIAQPINKCSTVDLTDAIWDQSMLKTATIDGNVYLVNTLKSPFSGSNLVYYNKPLFARNNIKTPAQLYAEGNWTWETFEETCKKLVSLGYTGANINPTILADSAGASFVMYDYKTNKFSSGVDKPELKKAYETYASWKEQGLLGGTLQGMRTGSTGMYVVGTYGLKANGLWKDMNPEDVGYTYLPAIDKNTPCRISSIYRMYGICKSAPHANAAGYFLRHYLDCENHDLKDLFITYDAGAFYYQLINTVADQKYFNFDNECASLIGITETNFVSEVSNAPVAQVNGKIQALSTLANQAVNKANKLIDDTKKAYK